MVVCGTGPWHAANLLLHKPTQKCTPMVPAAAHAYSLQCCPRCFSVQRANKLCALTGPLLPPLAQAHLAMPLQVALVHSRQLLLSGGSQVVALNQGTVVKGSVGSKATSSARRMISTYSWSTKYRGLRRTVLTNAAERPGSSDGQVCRDMQAGHKRPVAEQPATERWGWAVVMGMMQAGQRHTLAVLAKGKATISWPPGHSRLRSLHLSLLPPPGNVQLTLLGAAQLGIYPAAVACVQPLPHGLVVVAVAVVVPGHRCIGPLALAIEVLDLVVHQRLAGRREFGRGG